MLPLQLLPPSLVSPLPVLPPWCLLVCVCVPVYVHECLFVCVCPCTRDGNPESWPHDKWPPSSPQLAVAETIKKSRQRRAHTKKRKGKKKGRRRTERRKRERAGKEGKPSCTQHNANESLAEAQSCSERVPLTNPPPPSRTPPPLPDKLKSFGAVKHGGEREGRKRRRKERWGEQGRRRDRERGHGRD